MTTSAEIFKALTRSLEDIDDRKILQTRFKGVAVFDLQGEDDNNSWRLDATQGTLEKESNSNVNSTNNNNNNNTVRVTTTISVLQDLLSQKLTPQQAFAQGKLRIKVVLQAIRKNLLEAPITSRL